MSTPEMIEVDKELKMNAAVGFIARRLISLDEETLMDLEHMVEHWNHESFTTKDIRSSIEGHMALSIAVQVFVGDLEDELAEMCMNSGDFPEENIKLLERILDKIRTSGYEKFLYVGKEK